MQHRFNEQSATPEQQRRTQEFVRELYNETPDVAKALKLIASGIVLNADVEGYEAQLPPLAHAADRGQLVIVKALVAAGADVNLSGKYGEAPLEAAAFSGNADVVRFLIDNGAKVNRQDPNGQTALMEAVEQSQEQAARVLVEAGADVLLADANGRTVFDYARVAQARQPLVTLLRDKSRAENGGDAEFKEVNILVTNPRDCNERIRQRNCIVSAALDQGARVLDCDPDIYCALISCNDAIRDKLKQKFPDACIEDNGGSFYHDCDPFPPPPKPGL